MKPLSHAIERMGTESAFEVGPEIAAWEQQGYDIIRFNIGEPGANIPPAAQKAAILSLRNNHTHYTPSAGAEKLRAKIAHYLTVTRQIDYKVDDIILTPGGKAVIGGTLLMLVNPGEEVIYPTPCYPIYESMINFCQAKGVPIHLKEQTAFRLDINEMKWKIGPQTKLIILNSPSNPTGGVLEREDLGAIARLAIKYDCYILSDEIYSRLIFDRHYQPVNYQGNMIRVAPSIVSEPGMAERTVILDGFSKTYAMTGLRVGFMATKNPLLCQKFLRVAINLWSCLPQPCMDAAEAALGKDQSGIKEEIRQYRLKRDTAVRMINRINGFRCHPPKGSFYLFINVTDVCRRMGWKDADQLRHYLLTYDKVHKKGVAVLKRGHFGRKQADEKEEYIRISFAGKMEDLIEGIKRIKEAVG